MDLNYAIFRSEPVYTLNDLAQIGAHNKREKSSYNSNPFILNLDEFEIDNYIKKRIISGEKIEDIIDNLENNTYLFNEI